MTPSLKRRKQKILAAGIAAILLLGFVAFWALPPGERILGRVVATQLSRLLGADVAVERFETNFISRIHLHNLRIPNAEKVGGASLACRDLTIQYVLFPLIRRHVRLDKIDADSLFIHVNPDVLKGERGTGNVDL